MSLLYRSPTREFGSSPKIQVYIPITNCINKQQAQVIFLSASFFLNANTQTMLKERLVIPRWSESRTLVSTPLFLTYKRYCFHSWKTSLFPCSFVLNKGSSLFTFRHISHLSLLKNKKNAKSVQRNNERQKERGRVKEPKDKWEHPLALRGGFRVRKRDMKRQHKEHVHHYPK